MNIGIALLRLALGLLLTGHGLQKATGWFRGPGLAVVGQLFESWGFRPGRAMAVLAAGCEITAGVLLAAGLLMPLATAIAVGTMITAAAPSISNGLWAARGGAELPVVYAIIAASLDFTGPGRYSADRLAGLTEPAWVPAASLLAAVLISLGPLLRRRAALRRDDTEQVLAA
jgi:putative oxidoreductase